MRWSTGWLVLVLLLALGRAANAETVRDQASDFSVDINEPAASLCTALPPQTPDAGPCNENDRALATGFTAAIGQGRTAIGLVVAHFDGWDESLVVLKDAPNDTESNQHGADSFAGGFREGVRKNLPRDAHVLDASLPMHGEILRIGGVQLIRAAVKVEHASVPSSLGNHSQIVYEVIAKDAVYLLAFGFDLANYDQAAAVAERTIRTLHASPGAPEPIAPSSPPPGSPQAEWDRGRSAGLVFLAAVVLGIAGTIWINRSRKKK